MKWVIPILVVVSSLIVWSCEESDTTPPTVSIQSPISGETVQEIVTINVSTNDNVGIDRVDFFIDDSLHIQDDSSPYTYNWNTTNYSDESSHIITVISYDNSENETVSQPVLVTVNNTSSYPTQISITSVEYNTIEMVVHWEISTDSDFGYYELFSSNSEDGEKTQWFSGDEREFNSTVISDFNLLNPIWLWISVTDTVGFTTSSVEYIVTEGPPTTPEITLIEYINDSFIIHWIPNEDVDFVSYSLFQSDSSDMGVKEEILISTNKMDSTYIVSGIVLNESFYYQIEVEDIFGLISSSEVKSGSSFQKIVFISDRTGNDEICIMDINGENQRVLTNGMSHVYNPIFSPDGNMIVFTSDKDGDRDIYLMNQYGKDMVNLTNDPNSHQVVPQFTPDGQHIVYKSNGIYIMNLEGNNKTLLTNTEVTGVYPRITPDGSQIVYCSRLSGGRNDIFIVNIDGSNVQNLTNYFNNGSSQNHDISPDGLRIVFQSQFPNFHNEISIMDIDGGNRVSLTNNSVDDNHPLFSPNGSQILFFSYRDGIWDYYLLDLDGVGEVNITNSETYVYNPQFSPGGESIIYSTETDGNSQVTLLDLSSGEKINLSNNQYSDTFPRIQPIHN